LRRDDIHALHLHALLLLTACDDRVAGQSAHGHKERPLKVLQDWTCSFHTCSASSFFKARFSIFDEWNQRVIMQTTTQEAVIMELKD